MGCFFWMLAVTIILIAGVAFPPIWAMLPIMAIVYILKAMQRHRDKVTIAQTRAIIEAINDSKNQT